jgi:hypothetical protein
VAKETEGQGSDFAISAGWVGWKWPHFAIGHGWISTHHSALAGALVALDDQAAIQSVLLHFLV